MGTPRELEAGLTAFCRWVEWVALALRGTWEVVRGPGHSMCVPAQHILSCRSDRWLRFPSPPTTREDPCSLWSPCQARSRVKSGQPRGRAACVSPGFQALAPRCALCLACTPRASVIPGWHLLGNVLPGSQVWGSKRPSWLFIHLDSGLCFGKKDMGSWNRIQKQRWGWRLGGAHIQGGPPHGWGSPRSSLPHCWGPAARP